MTKICGICKIEKDSSAFGPDKQTKDGFRFECKECRKVNYYKNREKNLLQRKLSHQKHKEKHNKKDRERYQDKKEERLEYQHKYTQKNKDEIYRKNKIYREKNRDKINSKRRKPPKFIKPEVPENHTFCNKCQNIKPNEEFNKRFKNGKLYIPPTCKDCISKRWKNYYKKNKEILLKNGKEYTNNNQEKVKIRKRKYRQSEQGKIVTKAYKNRPEVKMANRLRFSLKKAVRDYNAHKKQPTLKYLGCDLPFFIEYLKNLIPPGYQYEDLFNGILQLDHITALCTVDLTKEENLLKVCHYTNIRPLFWRDNLIKASEDKKKKFIPHEVS